MPTLMCLAGLPGVGKSTIARRVADETGALWLWIDEIETAMRGSHMDVKDLADGGYAAAQAVARRALIQGYDVIADCVNPVALTRNSWRAVSKDVGATHIDVEIGCSDTVAHRKRVETRVVDLKGWVGPDWAAVQGRSFEPLEDADMRLDTSLMTIEESVDALCAVFGAQEAE